jgi:hypothetical protein
MWTEATPRREYEISTYDIPYVTNSMSTKYCGTLRLFHFHEQVWIYFRYNGSYKGHFRIINYSFSALWNQVLYTHPTRSIKFRLLFREVNSGDDTNNIFMNTTSKEQKNLAYMPASFHQRSYTKFYRVGCHYILRSWAFVFPGFTTHIDKQSLCVHHAVRFILSTRHAVLYEYATTIMFLIKAGYTRCASYIYVLYATCLWNLFGPTWIYCFLPAFKIQDWFQEQFHAYNRSTKGHDIKHLFYTTAVT